MRRYFFAGRAEEVVAWPVLRNHFFGEVMRKKSKQIGLGFTARWYCYSYAGIPDYYATKGWLRHPLIGVINCGGMVDGTNNVHSGNDKDIYTHEVVHLFSQRRSKEPPHLLEEGLATLIGGSVEHDYAWHRANLKRYLATNPSVDLRDRCNTVIRDYINEDTSVPNHRRRALPTHPRFGGTKTPAPRRQGGALPGDVRRRGPPGLRSRGTA